jgi:predicted nucleotide-binding protein (sugar kinase/HSP70/actin superfamily)
MDIDLSKGYGPFMASLYRLGRRLGHRPVKCINAVLQGINGMIGYGRAYMKQQKQSRRKAAGDVASPGFVILSRGYCLMDPALNLGLKAMLEERGYPVSYGIHNHNLNIYG